MLVDIITKGGWVMYPLLVCSIISLAVIIERIVFWLGIVRHQNKNAVNTILEYAESNNIEQAILEAQNSSDYISEILLQGFQHKNASFRDALEMSANEQIQYMKRFLPILDTIITLAPLLGIFGTVTGIIVSFKFFGHNAVPDPAQVTSGIAQALITTAAGLGVAMLSLIPYNYFISRIETAEHRIEQYATRLEMIFDKETVSTDENTSTE